MRKIIFKVLLVLIGINFLYVLSGVIHYPLYHVDVYSIWLLKAKAFFIYGGFPLNFLKTIGYSHPQYPVLLPFLYSLVYQVIGEVNELYLLALYPHIYLLILYLAYQLFLKLRITKTRSLFFVYLYSMFSPLLAQAGREHAGMADIVLTLIYWIAVHVAYQIVIKQKKRLIWVIVFLVSVASQIKFEGIFLIWIIWFLPISKKKRFFWSLLSGVPAVVWIYLRSYLKIPGDYGVGLAAVNQIMPELLVVIKGIVAEMLNIKNWYVFWIAFWTVIIIQKSKDKFVMKVIEPTILLMAGSFIIMYFLIQLDTAAQVSSSIDRIMLQLSPFYYTFFVHRTSIVFDKMS